MLNVDKPIASRIIELIGSEGLPEGAHLPAQWLADRLRVSRSPVNEALGLLHDKGFVRREPNRGYFLAQAVGATPVQMADALGIEPEAQLASIYFQVAEDRLRGKLPDSFSEMQLRKQYGLTPAQTQGLLARMASEGWAQKKPGYGWEFSPMLTTPESLLQSYRLRLALEPAALLEPGYRLDPQKLARCRSAEMHLLQGGIETDSADQLHERGVFFHETLVEGSGNPFFIDAIRRVNRVRRLLALRAMQDRKRYKQHCRQHLHLLQLLEQERNEEASQALREHLQSTLRNYAKLTDILSTEPRKRTP
jgi:DNA-binding GntR family transcriptional regulator